MELQECYTFDDVLIRPAESKVLPGDVQTSTKFTKEILLNIPLVSSAMDTVTESKLAIAMAQAGGVGVIHRNMEQDKQAEEVLRVKKYESGMVIDPVTVSVNANLGELQKLKLKYNISGFPVVDNRGKVVGIITNRDVRFASDANQPIVDLMTSDNLITAPEGTSSEGALNLLHKHKIEKLILVNEEYCCAGLITVTDIEKSERYPGATKDEQGRLRVAAATGVGEDGIVRAKKLIEAGADAVVVDTAHGHSLGVLEIIEKIKKLSNNTQIIGGNVATYEGAKALIKAGVDAVKVGIGPGSICTTRVVTGVGVPQFSAILEVSRACNESDTPLIADGGVRYSGDLSKAIGAGADSVMIGSILAGTEEAPGEVFLYQGRSYKSYRGMGSLAAMADGSSDRYYQQDQTDLNKFVPEGVEGRVPYKGAVSEVIFQLVGGLKSAMGYTGNSNLNEMKKNCHFQKITPASVREGHIHDIAVTKEAPNYKTEI